MSYATMCQACDGSGRFQRPKAKVDGIVYPAIDEECLTCGGCGEMCADCRYPFDQCDCEDDCE